MITVEHSDNDNGEQRIMKTFQNDNGNVWNVNDWKL